MNKPTSPDPIPPFNRGALRHGVVSRLLTAIFEGELPTGARLVARRLAEDLGISATPIREALVELEQVGMVQLLHNRGAMVKPFGLEQLREIHHVRRVLEAEATRCACGRIQDEDLRAVKREVQTLTMGSMHGSTHWLRQVMVLDGRLHELVAVHCGNTRLADELHRYNTLAQAAREVIMRRAPVPPVSLGPYVPVLDALLAEQAEAAATAMANKIDATLVFNAAAIFGEA